MSPARDTAGNAFPSSTNCRGPRRVWRGAGGGKRTKPRSSSYPNCIQHARRSSICQTICLVGNLCGQCRASGGRSATRSHQGVPLTPKQWPRADPTSPSPPRVGGGEGRGEEVPRSPPTAPQEYSPRGQLLAGRPGRTDPTGWSPSQLSVAPPRSGLSHVDRSSTVALPAALSLSFGSFFFFRPLTPERCRGISRKNKKKTKNQIRVNDVRFFRPRLFNMGKRRKQTCIRRTVFNAPLNRSVEHEHDDEHEDEICRTACRR